LTTYWSDPSQKKTSLLTSYWSGSTSSSRFFGRPASRRGSLSSLFQVALHLPSWNPSQPRTCQVSPTHVYVHIICHNQGWRRTADEVSDAMNMFSIHVLQRRNVKRFRGGLVFKAHRRSYHSTPGLRVKTSPSLLSISSWSLLLSKVTHMVVRSSREEKIAVRGTDPESNIN